MISFEALLLHSRFILAPDESSDGTKVCLPTSFVFTPRRRTPPVAAVAPVHPVAKPTEAEIQEQVRGQ